MGAVKPVGGSVITKEGRMELSARNQITGTITAIELGAVMADVSVEIGSG